MIPRVPCQYGCLDREIEYAPSDGANFAGGINIFPVVMPWYHSQHHFLSSRHAQGSTDLFHRNMA